MGTSVKTVFLTLAIVMLVFTMAYGAGDAARGMKLFNDTKFAGATSGKSCSSCHPGGKGIENAAGKSKITIMGNEVNSLEDAVNVCIKGPLGGRPIAKDSQDMMDIVAYIKSLKGTNK